MSADTDVVLSPDRPDVIAELFDGETVIVHLRTGCYYSLDAAGTLAWRMLTGGARASQVASALAEHGIEPAATRAFVDELTTEELLVAGAPEEPAALQLAPEPPAPAPLAPPTVQRFTDLQDLLLLDPVHDIDLYGEAWPQAGSDASGGI